MFNLTFALFFLLDALFAHMVFGEPWLVIFLVLCSGYFFFEQYRFYYEADTRQLEANKQLTARLKSQLAEAHRLSIEQLGGADEQYKQRVADLLVDAAHHLASSDLGVRPLDGVNYDYLCRMEGLKIVGQAMLYILLYRDQAEAEIHHAGQHSR
jgi:hypothetical protein